MFKDFENEFLLKVIKSFGPNSQLSMLQEECAELIVSISHYKRGRCGPKTVIDEIADVLILIQQINLYLTKVSNSEEDLREAIIRKTNRLRERLDIQ